MDRLWEKVDQRGGSEACWLWTGSNDGVYGLISVAGRLVKAHRLVWELTNGPIPPGLHVLHNCPTGDNPLCCNPAHLWVGTLAANNADRDRKGRQALGERNGRSRLTTEQVIDLRRLAASGLSQSALARRFGVQRSAIWHILTGRTWKHLPTLKTG